MTIEEERQITIYVTKDKRGEKPVQRLRRLARERNRSMNFVALEALLQYLEKEEKKS